MEYRKFGSKVDYKVSALGFGSMRFPYLPDGQVDEAEAIRMVRHAIDNGVNYVDTAYMYHNGLSEVIVGKALKEGYRAKTKVATKAPVFYMKKADDFEIFLEEQLGRLDDHFIDFYLLHALNKERWEKIVLKYDVLKKMERAKKEGKIGSIGFSYHDSDFTRFKEIIDGYDSWDFCQIQLNYLDMENQAGVEGLRYAASKGLGVIIMEPLLGGSLANPPEAVESIFEMAEVHSERTPVEWALDFLWDMPEVSLLLSGMSSMEQTKDNLLYAGRSKVNMLSEQEKAVISRVQETYKDLVLVPCTKCQYCMPCPFGVEIPQVFEAYNKSASYTKGEAASLYKNLTGKADQCAVCRKCEKMCPQKIEISSKMKEIATFF
ncbi:MAG: aldo/keto reductase [Clostridia bacterium]|jgi:predicted aldo/keto reductase-like oxidoreductase|nr:aldo/keto reductase [Clostridia bacterium]